MWWRLLLSGAQPREESRHVGRSLCKLGPGHYYVNSGGPSMVAARGSVSVGVPRSSLWEAGRGVCRWRGAGGDSTCKGLEVGNAPMFEGPQPGSGDRAVWDEVGG